MLESLRNAGKTWVAKLLMLLLAGSFGVWGIRDIFGGFRATALATVGSQDISSVEYTNTYRRALQNLAQQTGQNVTAEEARKMGFDRTILNNLIQSAALDAQSSSLKLSISPKQIVEEATGNPAFRGADGKFDPALFSRLLAQNGMNEEIFLSNESRNKVRSAITGAVDGGIKPPKTLVEAMSLYQTEQRDVKYFTITAAEADVAAPTDEELKKQYEATPAAYTAPEYRSIAIMKVEPADIADKIAITPEDLAKGYEKYKLDYFTPEKRTILQISFPSVDEAKKAKEKIAAGTDFMAIAKERGASEADITFADRKKADFLDKTIADAAFALKQGAVSDAVSGSLVTALLMAKTVTPEKQATIDEVKAELTKKLQAEKAQDEIQSIYDAVEDGRAAQTKFEDIAKAQGIPFKLISAVSAAGLDHSGKDVDLPDKQDVLKAAFDSDVGVENNALTPKDGYFWYDVREVTPSKLKPLDMVKDQVKGDVIAAKIRALLTERATKLVANLRTGAALDAMATENKATIKTAQGLKRNEAAAEFDIPAITALFSVPVSGYAWTLEGDGKAAKIMQSQAVLSAPFDSTSEASKALTKTLAAAEAKDVMAAYLKALQDQVGVSINETLWQQVSGTSQPSP
jgi:peptidyl-prolyl cis-trans isomerase D